MHLSNYDMNEFLVSRLKPLTNLSCLMAEDGTSIEKGCIYIAQPGKHLLIKDGQFRLGYGPEENNFRPSIDVFFRSAAAAYDSQTIGVILTGLMQDGTSGMEAIRACGGTLIVQDPSDAEYPNMPQSVLNNMQVDFSVEAPAIARTIAQVVTHKEAIRKPVPHQVAADADRSARMAVGIDGMEEFGLRSEYGCPDCGGILWKQTGGDNLKHYRCHIGHAFLEDELLQQQLRITESSIWMAVRMMEERKHLLVNKLQEYNRKGVPQLARGFDRKIDDLQEHIKQLKNLLVAIETRQQ